MILFISPLQRRVAVDGAPNTIFEWHWSYGFEESRSYQGLTKEEAEDKAIRIEEDMRLQILIDLSMP